MIIYGTKQTVDRYKIDVEECNEQVDDLFKFGIKIFYYNGKKCLQVINFATKLTIVLYNVNKADLKHLDEIISVRIFEIFKEDEDFVQLLAKYFTDAIGIQFGKLSNRSMTSSLNRNEYMFIEDLAVEEFNDIDTFFPHYDMNKFINFENLATKIINKKTRYFYPAKEFKQAVIEYYK